MSANKLAVFDIDGTLVQSLAVDEACFVRAFAEVLGIEDIDTDWAHYDHVTDDGMTMSPMTASPTRLFASGLVADPTEPR